MENYAILLAAGNGSRMGMNGKKQFMKVLDKPLIYYSLAAFEASDCIDVVIIVAPEEDFAYLKEEIIGKYKFKKVGLLTEGGKERYESVWRGLQLLENREGNVFIHDSARPLVTEEILKRNLEAVQQHGACVTGMPAKDTIKVSAEDGFVESTLARDSLWTIQTPQTFTIDIAYQAFERLVEVGITNVTDDSMVVERMLNRPVKLVEGSYENIKVTTSEDLVLVKAFLEQRSYAEEAE